MNRRMKNKITKRENAKRQEEILNEISQLFTVEGKIFKNSYFVFYKGQNSVCYFQLKETPNWRYGIWLYDKGYEIFGEHIDLIDNFKPSQTYLSYGSEMDGFLNRVKEISSNPKLYFVDALTGNALFAYKKEGYENDIWYEGYQVVREFNEECGLWNKYHRDETITQDDFVNRKYKEFFDSKEEKEKNKKTDRVYAFNFFEELPNMFNEVIALGVIDGNKNGLRCFPRYSLRVAVNQEVSQERLNQLFEEIDDLVWEKSYAEEMKTREHQFSLFSCSNYLGDIKVCDYKYLKSKN